MDRARPPSPNYAILLRRADHISEHGGAFNPPGRLNQHLRQSMAIKDIVPED